MIPKLESDSQRRVYLALTDDWQPARTLAEHAGISLKGAGTALRCSRSWLAGTRSASTPAEPTSTGDADLSLAS